jgi:AraC family ethanolamine operon transcriptional activator
MNTLCNSKVFDWDLIADQQFLNLEEFSDSIRGWDFELHQLTPGKSSIELLQFGHPEFMLTRFYFEQSYQQGGSAPPNHLTFGLCEERIEKSITPDGIIQQDNIFCFPSDRELMAIIPPNFKGFTLSVSEALIAEVEESCGLQEASPRAGSPQQVRHCDHSEMKEIRQALRHACCSLASIKNTANSTEIIHNQEFDLIRHLLLALAGSRPADKLRLTGRKQIILQRVRGYIEANADKAITVLELAKASGCCVRTLEYVFRDCFNVTPKAYLNSRRLVGAQHELIRSLPLNSTVSEIASRWGFWHMSQFATDYRRFFGELPSATLNRTRGIKKC